MTKTKKTNDALITKFGVDSSALSQVSSFIQHVKPAELFQQMLVFGLASKSPVEARFRVIGKGLIEQATGKRVLFSGYEWMGFKIPGGYYKPDWCYLLNNGEWVFTEVKASKMQTNYRDARSKLRAAATLNPWAMFYEARPGKPDWNLEKIEPDQVFLETMIKFFEEVENAS